MATAEINVEEAVAALSPVLQQKMARLCLAGFKFVPEASLLFAWKVIAPDGTVDRAVSLAHAIEARFWRTRYRAGDEA